MLMAKTSMMKKWQSIINKSARVDVYATSENESQACQHARKRSSDFWSTRHRDMVDDASQDK